MDMLATDVQPGSDGLLFHPYLQGERAPYWDSKLRADFLGVTMHHGRAHFVRALYEGIAYAMRDAMTAAETLGLRYDTLRIIGGGARARRGGRSWPTCSERASSFRPTVTPRLVLPRRGDWGRVVRRHGGRSRQVLPCSRDTRTIG